MSKYLPIVECLPKGEMQRRHALCRRILATMFPSANGLLVFSRLNIYYLTGTLANGIFWLPREGEPVLCVRSGEARCRLESPVSNIYGLDLYSSECVADTSNKLNEFSAFAHICQDSSSPLGETVAAEMTHLPWALAMQLQKALPQCTFVEGDGVLLRARARKSSWELAKMRLAGARHHAVVCEILPQHMVHGMSEQDVAVLAWKEFFKLGHGGVQRMGNFGEECFLGHISVGENGNYPSHFNGPLGLKGLHPATPYMGNAKSIWNKGQILALDIGFILEGYHTDKTQMYFAGTPAQIPDNVRKAHEACVEIQNRAAEGLKCGAVPAELWEQAQQRAQKLGVAEGFMGLGNNKVPFLGHGIGLVVDEYPVVAARFDEPLEEGMVLAIEPKVGLPGIGMVGVENTFEVCPEGGRSLTGNDYAIITC